MKSLITEIEIGGNELWPLLEIRLNTKRRSLLGYVQRVGTRRWVAETTSDDGLVAATDDGYAYSLHETRAAATLAVVLRAGGIGP